MKLKPSIIDRLALMICGDEPHTSFPYRSSSYLTGFFREIDLDYQHDGSTRRHWVAGVLSNLNTDLNPKSPYPSPELKKIIEHLLDPTNFMDLNQNIAINKVNNILKSQSLYVEKDKNTGNTSLRKVMNDFISTSIDANDARSTISFLPSVFDIPKKPVVDELVSVMMPFDMEFDNVIETIKEACSNENMICHRADDLWNNSTIIQDIFELIYCSSIVIVDFTSKNPNVFYEAGIAHTLGKNVIPITQSMDDIPFNLGHHRILKYLNNDEGMHHLKDTLGHKLKNLKQS
ncbi:MAG TPA: hypothetical protein C5S51_03250 [Methanosarcinaceae archaeon]|nr:hypothetical protein [Methanosarcinaceae archaeon]